MGSLGGIAGIVAAVEVTSAANGSLATHCQLVHAPSQCCQTKHPMSNAEGNAQLSPKEQTSLANAIRSKQISARKPNEIFNLYKSLFTAVAASRPSSGTRLTTLCELSDTRPTSFPAKTTCHILSLMVRPSHLAILKPPSKSQAVWRCWRLRKMPRFSPSQRFGSP